MNKISKKTQFDYSYLADNEVEVKKIKKNHHFAFCIEKKCIFAFQKHARGV